MSKCELLANVESRGFPFSILAHLDIGYWDCWLLDIPQWER